MTQLWHTEPHGSVIHVCDYKGRTWHRCGDASAARQVITNLRDRYTTEFEVDKQWQKRNAIVEEFRAKYRLLTGRHSGSGYGARTSGRSTGSPHAGVTTDQ